MMCYNRVVEGSQAFLFAGQIAAILLMSGSLDKNPAEQSSGYLVGGIVRSADCRTLSRTKKDEILERDCYICAYCDGWATVVDHVCPWSWSHCDDEYNLVASCDYCNAIAHDLVFDDFTAKRMYIRNRLKHKRTHIPHHRAECAFCHGPIMMNDRKSTNLLCGECAEKAGYFHGDKMVKVRHKPSQEG